MMCVCVCVCIYIYIYIYIYTVDHLAFKFHCSHKQPQFFFCKCPCIVLVILDIVFYKLLQLKISNKKHTLKNAYIYTCTKFPPHTFMQLTLGSLLNLLIFTHCFRFGYYWFEISASMYEIHATKCGVNCAWVSSYCITKLFMPVNSWFFWGLRWMSLYSFLRWVGGEEHKEMFIKLV